MKQHRQFSSGMSDATRRRVRVRRLGAWAEAAAGVLVVTFWLVVADAASTALGA
jgi:hypothetical protein